MDARDILDSRSSEILELFYTIDKIRQVIDEHINTGNPALTDGSFLDNRDVCKLLRISPRTLQDYRDKRLVAFYKLEGKILYKMSDIRSLLERNYYDAWRRKR